MASVDTAPAKRVLRHRQSRRYFRDGQWIQSLEQASEFHSIQEVVEACVRNELRDVDLVLRFDGLSIEIMVRIR